jgi:hypothetical protein
MSVTSDNSSYTPKTVRRGKIYFRIYILRKTPKVGNMKMKQCRINMQPCLHLRQGGHCGSGANSTNAR